VKCKPQIGCSVAESEIRCTVHLSRCEYPNSTFWLRFRKIARTYFGRRDHAVNIYLSLAVHRHLGQLLHFRAYWEETIGTDLPMADSPCARAPVLGTVKISV
jgi:hypothetical protein